jgi:hypothetical protein
MGENGQLVATTLRQRLTKSNFKDLIPLLRISRKEQWSGSFLARAGCTRHDISHPGRSYLSSLTFRRYLGMLI